MFRKAMIAAAAVLAIGGVTAASTSADAAPRGFGGGYHGAGYHGEGVREGFRGGRDGGDWRVGPAWGYGGDCGWRWSPYLGRYVNACW